MKRFNASTNDLRAWLLLWLHSEIQGTSQHARMELWHYSPVHVWRILTGLLRDGLVERFATMGSRGVLVYVYYLSGEGKVVVEQHRDELERAARRAKTVRDINTAVR